MKSTEFIIEGLDISYPDSYLRRSLQKMFPDSYIAPRCSPSEISITFRGTVNDATQLTHHATRSGWYVTSEQVTGVDTKFTLHKKYGTNVTQHILKKFSHLYHITPTANVAKILQIGLSPRSLNKTSIHPARVYLSISPDAAIDLIPQMYKSNTSGDWTVLEIDPKSANRLYPDPHFDYGVYTVDNIPPTAICVFKKVLS